MKIIFDSTIVSFVKTSVLNIFDVANDNLSMKKFLKAMPVSFDRVYKFNLTVACRYIITG